MRPLVVLPCLVAVLACANTGSEPAGQATAAQRAMLDQAGAMLADSTLALVDAVRDAVAPQPVESLVLVYLPTVLDAAAPDARRAVPVHGRQLRPRPCRV